MAKFVSFMGLVAVVWVLAALIIPAKIYKWLGPVLIEKDQSYPRKTKYFALLVGILAALVQAVAVIFVVMVGQAIFFD